MFSNLGVPAYTILLFLPFSTSTVFTLIGDKHVNLISLSKTGSGSISTVWISKSQSATFKFFDESRPSARCRMNSL